MAYKNLVFFDKTGHEINASYDATSQVWTLSVFMAETSIRLIETDSVYVMERLIYAGQKQLGYPHSLPSMATKLTAMPSVNDAQIGLFAVVNPLHNEPDFLPQPTLAFDLDNIIGDSIDLASGLVITSVIEHLAMRIDIYTTSPNEGVFDNTITLTDDKGQKVAIINVHSEVEGQDERMDVAQARLSRQITESLEFIFRDSDINEDLPDHKLLNRKKKQFAAQHQNILPYISSVRGLISFVRYFGYYDVRLKEHWKNVNNGKLHLRLLTLGDSSISTLDSADNIPVYPFVRVPELSLYYDIVRPKNPAQFDEDGLPITERTFAYSVEEILIKLFGLKNFLESEAITGIAKITDIVGEYEVFKQDRIIAWEDKTKTLIGNYAKQPEFTVDKNFDYMADLRAIVDTYHCTLPVNWTVATSSPDPIGENITCWIGYFNPFNRQAPEFIDEPNVPVGMLVNLLNTSFFQPWTGVGLTWNQAGSNNLTITWANIDKIEYYEVEWIVTYATSNLAKKSFQYKARVKSSSLSQEVILPYYGKYDVTLILHGYDNNTASITHNGFLEVYPKNPDFISFYRIYESELQTWATNYLKWSDIYNQWNEKIFDNSRYIYQDADIQYKSMVTTRYLDLAYLGIENVGIADETWNQHQVASWNDHKYSSWAYTHFDREKPSNFTIQTIFANGILQISKGLFQFPSDLNVNEWIRGAKLLNASADPDISNYYYVARPITNPAYIDAVAKYDGRNGERWVGTSGFITVEPNQDGLTWADCRNVPWTNVPILWGNSYNIYYAASKENPFTFDNIKVYGSNFEVPTVVPVLFTIDNCTVAGKTDAFWSVIDEFGNTIVDRAEGRYFAYSFETPGHYSIKLDIVDTNGNEYTNIWNNRVKVSRPLDFQKMFYAKAS